MFYFLYLLLYIFFNVVTSPPILHPCQPSPCGPYSNCREIDNHAVCSCKNNFIGIPPNCRPECYISSECIQNRACINQKCSDPCIDKCGTNAFCQVVNHNPICSCLSGYTGDPFNACVIKESKNLISMQVHIDYN